MFFNLQIYLFFKMFSNDIIFFSKKIIIYINELHLQFRTPNS